jgi:hypothetical protein
MKRKNERLKTENSERRMISFDDDIIDEVYAKFEGAYPRGMVREVLEASINYLKQLQRFSGKLAVYVPHVGYLLTDRLFLEARMKVLQKKIMTEPLAQTEINALSVKRRKLGEIRKLGENNFHPFFRNASRLIEEKVFNRPFSCIQDAQDKVFYGKN